MLTHSLQRYGETGRRSPLETIAVWEGLNTMLEQGLIRPAIYAQYRGLESVPHALQDLAARKVWGKAIIDITSQHLQSKI